MHERGRPQPPQPPQAIHLHVDTRKQDFILLSLAAVHRTLARLAAKIDAIGGDAAQITALTAEIDAESKKMEEALAAFSTTGTDKSAT